MPLQRLGPYRLDRKLGVGAMGTVHAATVMEPTAGLDEGRRVALKIVHPRLLERRGFFQRFLREAQVGTSIRHENVVSTVLCDQLVVGGTPHAYLVMEFVEGRTLTALLDEVRRVPEALCRHIGVEICRGLAAMHTAGVIHRDLKPDNVLITADHHVKIMDLGLARLADEHLRLALTQGFVGTPRYAAPEQFGGKTDVGSDLHALGAILHELACGEPAFAGEAFTEVLRAVRETTPTRLGELVDGISPFLEEFIQKLLAKTPQERFATAAEALATLEEGERSAWWRTEGRRRSRDHRRPTTREATVGPFRGRADELSQLTRAFDLAAGGDGGVVLLTGEVGSGKSSLLAELTRRLQAAGRSHVVVAGAYPAGGCANPAEALVETLRAELGPEGSAAALEATPLLVPAFDALLNGFSAPADAMPLTAAATQTCLARVIEYVSVDRPALLVVEDLHFASPEGRALFSALAAAMTSERVLVIGTSRPDVAPQWTAEVLRLPNASLIELGRLSPTEIAAIVSDRLDASGASADLARRIARSASGNPYFALELLRELREDGRLRRTDAGRWTVDTPIQALRIPSTIRELISARVALLDDEERELLDVACCCGSEFDPLVVAEVLERRRMPTLSSLARIERRTRLVRAAGRGYRFDHEQARQFMYDGLHDRLREEIHTSIATVLLARHTASGTADPPTGETAVALTHHYLASDRPHVAARYLRAAQAHLAGAGRYERAIELGRVALARPGLLRGRERVTALLRQATCLERSGAREDQERCLLEANRLVDDRVLELHVWNQLGGLYWSTARYDDAERVFRDALERARVVGAPEIESHVTGNLGLVELSRGRLDSAVSLQRHHLELARDLGVVAWIANAHGNLGLTLFHRGELEAAHEQLQAQLELAIEHGDLSLQASAYGNLALILRALGLLLDARDYQERCLELRRSLGDRAGETEAWGGLGNVELSLGAHVRAIELIRRGLESSRRTLNRQAEAHALHNLGVAYLDLGDDTKGERYLQQALQLVVEHGVLRLRPATSLALGSLRARNGHTVAAEAMLRNAANLAREYGKHAVEVVALCTLATLDPTRVGQAEAALDRHRMALNAEQLREAHYLLWSATGSEAHLDTASELLTEALEQVPEEYRDGLRARRLDRAIADAAVLHRRGYGSIGEDDTTVTMD